MTINHVTKQYSNKKGVFDISMKLTPGAIHCLVGVNGAGKTTLIKVLLNQLKIDKGGLEWLDHPIQSNDYLYKKNIGYVPDDEVLLENMTPNEILQFVGRTYGLKKKDIEQKTSGIFDLLELDELNSNVSTFSRGMRKKVQLASALLGDIKLLILDEPTAGFDPSVIFVLRKLFTRLKEKGICILISTHHLDFANRICDHVTILEEGQMVIEGDLKKVLKSNQVAHLEDLFMSRTKHRHTEGLIDNAISHF